MSSPQSQQFNYIPIIEQQWEKADPVILTTPLPDMEFYKDIILVYQYPPENKLFVPTYVSADLQTHYAIYQLKDDSLKLLFTRQQIVFDGLVYFYIDRDITNFLFSLGLKKNEVENIKNKKYKLNVTDL